MLSKRFLISLLLIVIVSAVKSNEDEAELRDGDINHNWHQYKLRNG